MTDYCPKFPECDLPLRHEGPCEAKKPHTCDIPECGLCTPIRLRRCQDMFELTRRRMCKAFGVEPGKSWNNLEALARERTRVVKAILSVRQAEARLPPDVPEGAATPEEHEAMNQADRELDAALAGTIPTGVPELDKLLEAGVRSWSHKPGCPVMHTVAVGGPMCMCDDPEEE
jgi:hypothetical protein